MYVAAIVAFASCTKVEMQPDQPSDNGDVDNVPVENLESVKFTTAEVTTKTSIGEDNKTVSWDAEDIIAIFDGSGIREFKTTEGGKSAVFEGEAAVGATEYYGLYPYDAVASLTDGKIITSVAASQSGEFADHIAVAYTTSDKKQLAFKNVTAVVKFTLDEDYVTKVTLKGNNDEVLAGDLTVDYNQGEPSVTITNGFTAVSVGDGSSVMAKKDYYFVVAPQNLEGGLTLTLTYQSDSKTYWEQWLDATSTKKTIGVRTIDKKGTNEVNLLSGTLLDLGKINMTISIYSDGAADDQMDLGCKAYAWSTGDAKFLYAKEYAYSGDYGMSMTLGGSQWTQCYIRTTDGTAAKPGNTPVLDAAAAYDAGFYLCFAFRTSDKSIVDNLSVRLISYDESSEQYPYLAVYRPLSGYVTADGNWYEVKIPLCDMYACPGYYTLSDKGGRLAAAWWNTHSGRVADPFPWGKICKIDFGVADFYNTTENRPNLNTAIGTFCIDEISIKKCIK